MIGNFKMSLNLRRCLPHFKAIANIKDDVIRKKVLKDVCHEKCFQKALREIAKNTVKRNVPLPPKARRKLKNKEKIIRNLAKKYRSEASRKKVFVQSGGVLPYLIPAVIAVLSQMLRKPMN